MFKKLLFFMALMPLVSYAQLYTSSADTKFQPLDKSQITTDILYDRVYPMSELPDFNQTAIDTSQVYHFYHAYAEIQTADYTSRWSTVSWLKSNVKVQEQQNKIPIGILNVDFNIIDEYALQDNLIAFSGPDSLLVDVAGRSRSPYLERNGFVVSTLVENGEGSTVTFVTGPDFTMQAANPTISSLEADFGNGQGWQIIPLNGTKTVNFGNAGMYYIKYKLHFSNSTTRYTYSKIRINANSFITKRANLIQGAANIDCTLSTVGQFRSAISFQGYDESQAYAGAAEYRIFKGGNDLDKPVIVLDGFDPQEGEPDAIGTFQIYDEFLRFEGGSLGAQLRTSDFDIIPLNFIKYDDNGKIINGGTDYIERNAMVLVDFITQIRDCKEGNHPIKIIGFSMGGLVARYALRYMEQNGIPHDTDLFVSVDSPHKGATVPIGIQEIADLVDDITPFGLGNAADDLLDTPAAKQLLIHHSFADSKTAKGAPNFHDRFYNDLDTMGFPQQTRNIAVVNGLANGTPINSIGQKYLDAEIETGLIFFKVGGRMKAKLNYAPDKGQTKDALNFKIQLKLFLVRITLFKRIRQVTTLSTTGSYENSPGGFFDVENLVEDFLGANTEFQLFNSGFLNSIIGEVKLSLIDPNFSFIPVKSSLAYSGPIQDLYEDVSSRDLVCEGFTPLDSYFTAINNNEVHIDLNSQSANYIRQEILGNPQYPNLNITNGNVVERTHNICPGTDYTYTVKGCSAPSVNWQVSSNLTVVGSTGSSITVRAINSTVNESASITADYNGYNSSKNIWIGKPKLSGTSLLGSPNVHCNSIYIYEYSGTVAGADSTRWVVSLQFDDISAINGKELYVDPTNAGNGYVTYVASNDCGEIIICKPITVDGSNCGPAYTNFPGTYSCGDTGFRMSANYGIEPNPASTTLTIRDLRELSTTSSKSNLFKAKQPLIYKIYDFGGILMKEGSFRQQGSMQINVSGLKEGYYFLKIVHQDQAEVHQLIIE
ncbi:T9SS type A sorting domain-containing protein [Flavobacteriaceae bacterium M23B6Z8]